MKTVKVHETWGLRLKSGRVLTQGYSERPLRSLTDVAHDFDSSLPAIAEAVPVLISRTTTETWTW